MMNTWDRDRITWGKNNYLFALFVSFCHLNLESYSKIERLLQKQNLYQNTLVHFKRVIDPRACHFHISCALLNITKTKQNIQDAKKLLPPLAQKKWTMSVQNMWYTSKGTLNTINLRQKIWFFGVRLWFDRCFLQWWLFS